MSIQYGHGCSRAQLLTQVAADIASVINPCRSGSKSKTPLTDEAVRIVERVPAPNTILSMVVA